MRSLILGALCLGLAGCPQPALPRTEMTAEQARARLEKEGARRQRMAGHVKARLPGLQGVVASADLDVVLERPARLNVAVRSFFEQPMQVLATDGETVTLYDATGQSGPGHFFRGPVDGTTLSRLLPLPLWPGDVVALFLGAAPAHGARARLLGVDDRKGTYEVALEPELRGRVVVTARLADDALVRWIGFTPDGRRQIQMDYGDLRPAGGVTFAHRYRLAVTDDQGARQELVFEAREVEINGPPFDPAAFGLILPPGERWLPLPGLPPSGRSAKKWARARLLIRMGPA